MVLAQLGTDKAFEPARQRANVRLQVFLQVRSTTKMLTDLLNEVAREKIRLVAAHVIAAHQLASEIAAITRKHKLSLTAQGLRTIAELLDQEGAYNEAVKYYKKALVETAPRDPEILNNLGIALGRIGQVKEAVQILEEAITAKPAFVKAMNNMALVLADAGQSDRALAVLENALKKDPAYFIGLFNKGMIHYERQEWAMALAALREILVHPDRVREEHPELLALTHLWLSVILGRQHQWEESLREAVIAEELGADRGACLLNKLVALGAQGRRAEAREVLSELESDPLAEKFLLRPEIARALKEIRKDISDSTDPRVQLARIVADMESNLIPAGAPRYSRDQLHERG